MKTDLNYSATDCFENFPFPQESPRAVIEGLETLGERVYLARAAYMVEQQVGLTVTYNRMKDPSCSEQAIIELRAVHEELDRAVLRAYGWEDLAASRGPYCVSSGQERSEQESWDNRVIERLMGLNVQRAEGEVLRGLGGKKGKR